MKRSSSARNRITLLVGGLALACAVAGTTNGVETAGEEVLPRSRGAAERTAERTADRTAERTADRTAERTADRTAERIADRTAEKNKRIEGSSHPLLRASAPPRQTLPLPISAASSEPGPLIAKSAARKNYGAIGDELLEAVRKHFFDKARAAAWADAHKGYGREITDARAFAARTNALLAELKTSHTAYYIPTDTAYYALLSIFERGLKLETIRHVSAGLDIASLPEGHFVRTVLAGSVAEKAGLLRGDRLVTADGKAFVPYRSFKDKGGLAVKLTVERQPGQPPLQVTLKPRLVSPRLEWLEAQRASAKLIERGGRKIGYMSLFACAGTEYQDALQEAMLDTFQSADALIIDFRNGWGGCNPDFMNLFNPYVPVLSSIDAQGRRTDFDLVWRKPLFVLINEGSRSGKEVVAHAIKKHRVGTLVGERTAGAVVAGRAVLLSDRSLLYVAVSDGLVDGVRLEGNGVEPDVTVAAPLPFAAGKDAQLERALELAAGGNDGRG